VPGEVVQAATALTAEQAFDGLPDCLRPA